MFTNFYIYQKLTIFVFQTLCFYFLNFLSTYIFPESCGSFMFGRNWNSVRPDYLRVLVFSCKKNENSLFFMFILQRNSHVSLMLCKIMSKWIIHHDFHQMHTDILFIFC